MYGVVEISGHQYRVKAGDLIDVQKLENAEGSDVTLDKVLFIGGENLAVGTPLVKGASVTARVIKSDRSRKLLVLKRKPGMYKKKKGHRQHYTSLLVTEVTDGQGNSDKLDSKSPLVKKYLKK